MKKRIVLGCVRACVQLINAKKEIQFIETILFFIFHFKKKSKIEFKSLVKKK